VALFHRDIVSPHHNNKSNSASVIVNNLTLINSNIIKSTQGNFPVCVIVSTSLIFYVIFISFSTVHIGEHCIQDDILMLYHASYSCYQGQYKLMFHYGHCWYLCAYRARKRIFYLQHEKCTKT
jgi:hypothetical protein